MWMVDGGFFFFCLGVRFLFSLSASPVAVAGFFRPSSISAFPGMGFSYLHFSVSFFLFCMEFWWLLGVSLRVFWAKVFWPSISFSNLLRTLT